MHRPALSLAAALTLVACSSEAPDDPALPDAGTQDPLVPPTPPDEGDLASLDFVATASAPRGRVAAPAPPRADACPAGWSRRTLADGATCLPPPMVRCAPDERLAIDGTCRPFGAACPADGWPANLPADVEIRFVDPGAPAGGDGSRMQPFDRLALAVLDAPDGAVVALRAGDHPGPVEITRPMRLIGACAAGTRVVGQPSDTLATVTVLGGPVELRELTVTGPRIGVQVGREAPVVPSTLQLHTVRVDGAVRRGLSVWPQGTLDGVDVWVHGITGLPDRAGVAAISSGGELHLEDSTLETSEVGAAVFDLGLLNLRQVVVHDLRARIDGSGWGCVGTTDSDTRLEEVWIEDVEQFAVLAGRVQASRVGVRGVSPSRFGAAEANVGFLLDSDSRMEGISFQDVGTPSILFNAEGGKLVVEDLYFADPRDTRTFAVVAGNGADLELTRAWLEGADGVALAEAGTTGTLQDITARASPNVAIGVSEGAGPVSAERVAVETSSTAVFVKDPSSRLTVRHLEVGAGSSHAAVAEQGGNLELYHARIHAPGTGLATGPGGRGTSLHAEDVEILEPDLGVLGYGPEGLLSLRRIVIDAPVDAAGWVRDGRAEIEDLRVAGASLRPNVAAIVVKDAQALLRRVSLDEVGGSGLLFENCAVEVEDLSMTESPARARALGVVVYNEATCELTRARIEGFGFAMNSFGTGQISARDVTVVDFSEAGWFVENKVVLSRALVEQGQGLALHASLDADVTVEDLVVRDLERAGDVGGVGVATSGRARVRLDRARIERTGSASVLAAGSSRITARDVRILDGLRTSCEAPACLSSMASGLTVVEDALIDVERFEILRMPTAGLHVFDPAGLDAREGLVSECGVGLLAEGDGYDPARASLRVSYEGNTRASLTRQASIPPVRFEPERPPVPEGPPGG